jgi:hypothetical protein
LEGRGVLFLFDRVVKAKQGKVEWIGKGKVRQSRIRAKQGR